jgi:hypothetical protein
VILKAAHEVHGGGGAKFMLMYVEVHQPLNQRAYSQVVNETHWLYSCKLGMDVVRRIRGGEL